MVLTDRERTIATTAAIAVVGVGTAVLVALCNRRKIIQRFRGPLHGQSIRVISNAEECQQVVGTLRTHCQDYRVLGFDCEWVTEKGKRHPVALLQLASHRGLCALIRLCHMKRIPPELSELLNDPAILKVGIGSIEDAQLLRSDYNLKVESALDLRHLAEKVRVPGPYGLARLAEKTLGLQLDKHWRVRASDWEALELSERQLKYAASDAHVAVELFRIYADKLLPCGIFTTRKKWFNVLMGEIECFLDQRYKDPPSKSQKGTVNGGKNGKKKFLDSSKNSILELKRSMSTRAKPLYDNCLMQAPDGEVLCTCDRKKAEWYVIKELADIVSDQPTYTIRLRFEPKGRAVGDVGKYYQTAKENKCVVCGAKDSYIRKNIVPRDYRRHFPLVMKEHISHDVLLLCAPCHRQSTMNDENMRLKLASLSTAPFNSNDNPKEIRVESMADLRKAARALVYCADRIPAERQKSLQRKMQRLLGTGVQLTPEVLNHYANIQTAIPNGDYCAHGEKVVEYFKEQSGGLGELERMWREHFLRSMKPKFMPELWSVEHNVKRLEIRADEGRVNEEDLLLAGVNRPIRTGASTTNSSNSNGSGSLTTDSSLSTLSSSSSSAVLPLLSERESDNDSTARDVSSYRDEEVTLEPQSATAITSQLSFDEPDFYSNRDESRTVYASAAGGSRSNTFRKLANSDDDDDEDDDDDQYRTIRPEREDESELATANDFASLESSYDSDDSDSTLSQPSMTLLNSTDDWEAEANEPSVNGTLPFNEPQTSRKRN